MSHDIIGFGYFWGTTRKLQLKKTSSILLDLVVLEEVQVLTQLTQLIRWLHLGRYWKIYKVPLTSYNNKNIK